MTEPKGWSTARMIVHTAKPEHVVEYLRLLLPCKVCGAAPLVGCTRGLGEVQATHPQRGEG